MDRLTTLFLSCLLFAGGLTAQNVGINYDGSAPTMMLDVKSNTLSDGININNDGVNGDPILGYEVNGTRIVTLGVDDDDADKFKIGTTSITTNTRFSLLTNGRMGINTTTPGWLFQMTRGALAVGANATMSEFLNSDVNGVALSAQTSGATNPYNAFEGVTSYGGTTNVPSGVFGLHIYQSAAISSPGRGVFGHTNEYQGIGVYGSRFNSGGANTGWGGVFVADLGYTGFFGLYSDANLKTDIEPIQNATGLIQELRPVTYHYRNDLYPEAGFNTEMEYGLIAQEVQVVLPELVRSKQIPINGARSITALEDGSGQMEEFLALDYTRLIPILVKAVQEQQERIDALEAQLAEKPIPVDQNDQ